MSTTFIPIETTWREAGCLIAVGSAQLEAAAGGSSSEEQLGLAEMASPEFAGLVEVTIAGGQVQLIARVVDPTAAEKCRRSVYGGFSVTTIAAADGSTRVRRVSLIDSPAGFGKSALLKIGRTPVTTRKSSILCSRPEVTLMVHQARQRKAEEQRFSKAAAADNPTPGDHARPALFEIAP